MSDKQVFIAGLYPLFAKYENNPDLTHIRIPDGDMPKLLEDIYHYALLIKVAVESKVAITQLQATISKQADRIKELEEAPVKLYDLLMEQKTKRIQDLIRRNNKKADRIRQLEDALDKIDTTLYRVDLGTPLQECVDEAREKISEALSTSPEPTPEQEGDK